jgi:phosphoribosyl 1,2-cyclic phosphodiesterase
MTNEFTVKFWGVRGSHPAPGKGTVRYGGNTSCVEVRAGDHIIVLDAGTGIISLGRDLARRSRPAGQPLEVTLLLSHLHHDHTQGFPFFTPAYIPGARLHVYGPGTSVETLEKVLENNQNPATFPVTLRDMAAAKDIRSLKETETVLINMDGVRVEAAGSGADDETVRVRIHRSHAHPGGVYVYRIEWHGRSLVYATDTEGYVGTDRRLVNFARGADVLIHDAQYSEEHYRGLLTGFPATQGYGHSTATMACEVAVAASVRTLILFHHEPAYDDPMLDSIEAAARKLFPDVRAASEGMELTVGREHPTELMKLVPASRFAAAEGR